MNATTKAWLEGIKACEEGKRRASCPYGQLTIDMSPSVIQLANEWYGGWDTAATILRKLDGKETV